MTLIYLPLKQLSQMYPVSVKTLRSWIYSGKIRASKIGRHWMIARAEMERVIKENEFRPVHIKPLC